ncbi:restriction endonuclease subunit S [Cupriavidus sp. WGlv3]|uniref:restriction endonuclease subunit S n=1 Tax=Cupriavidus sp. WGlv3 TaxID=2919924 RepID=UPI0020914166|nr:restriction endonuclease subunit S [Cupriavidus sp. WGlv3]MCO4861261.1 restriction endonuclease subunit S [Cupriavidus sp. WGlv3]
MSSEWRACTLGKFVRLQRGHDLTASEQQPGNVPIMGSAGPNGTHNVALAKGPGVVVGRSGASAGRVHFCEVDYWPHNTCLYVTDFLGNNPRFAYYLLQTLDLAAFNSGSAQPSLNRNFLYTIPIRVAERGEQDAIVALLQSFDDRITLLRETNATLEAIAQALFKSWFVDFDPVHAKRNGLALDGVDEAAAEMFPDSFEDSPLGEIPAGWQITRIEDIAEKVGMGPFGSNIKVSTFVPNGVPVLSGKHLQETLLEDHAANCITEAHAERLKNSSVYSGDVVITHRGTLGQVSLIPQNSKHPSYMTSQSQFFLRCDKNRMTPEWITYFLRSATGQHLLLANASQVGVPSIAKPVSYLRSIKFVLPPLKILRRFSDVTASLHDTVVINRNRIETLSSIRDRLLPRLISGQLRLVEAEEVIAA